MVIFVVGGYEGESDAEIVDTDGVSNCAAANIPDYPKEMEGGVAALIGGVPTFCGGKQGQTSCYTYDKTQDPQWVQVRTDHIGYGRQRVEE